MEGQALVTRWQYRIVNLGTFNNAERMVGAFGALGADGWELAAMYDKGSNWLAGMEKGFALFKRAVPDGTEPVGPWAQADRADELGAAPSMLKNRSWLEQLLANGATSGDIAAELGVPVDDVRYAMKRYGFA